MLVDRTDLLAESGIRSHALGRRLAQPGADTQQPAHFLRTA